MSIHKLPDFVINRLKAGEVVQRPASLLKELVENSLDAGATELEITINDGGKSFLSLQDNGSGIELSDMDLLLERYATSKISSDQDLLSLESYGFRGEALASIAEVSKVSVLTRTTYAEIGTKLVRRGGENMIKHLAVPFEQGTLITVEDLFYNVPARLKFLKSAQTEFYYCYNYFVDIALYHYDKSFILKKNDKLIFDLKPVRDLQSRILDLFKKDWGEKLIPVAHKTEKLTISGIISDATLRFGSGENIKIYVNARPVQDKIIRKALLDAYLRQLIPGEYPMAILMFEVPADEVDVNVHPAKLQVKFADSQMIYQAVYQTVSELLGKHKIGSVEASFFQGKGNPSCSRFPQSSMPSLGGKPDFSSFFASEHPSEEKTSFFSPGIGGNAVQGSALFGSSAGGSQFGSFDAEEHQEHFYFHSDIGEYQILGQLRKSYIALQSDTALYLIDQHALAERIAFEKMKISQELTPETLLQPLKFEVSQIPHLEEKIEELNQLGFEIALLSENVLVIYAVPKVFVQYPVAMDVLLNYVLYLEQITFDHLLDGIYATKACKTSIKAGHKLSYLQMQQLIQEGFQEIPGMFVCQHGRPFFIKMGKSDIEKLFER